MSCDVRLVCFAFRVMDMIGADLSTSLKAHRSWSSSSSILSYVMIVVMGISELVKGRYQQMSSINCMHSSIVTTMLLADLSPSTVLYELQSNDYTLSRDLQRQAGNVSYEGPDCHCLFVRYTMLYLLYNAWL
ncbi:hypothetical protein MRB53_042270 [Persea americana]|nr:hypothetical protein MRB53_042270 [Persea americana]